MITRADVPAHGFLAVSRESPRLAQGFWSSDVDNVAKWVLRYIWFKEIKTMLQLKNPTVDPLAEDPAGLRETWRILGMKPPKTYLASSDLLNVRLWLRAHSIPFVAVQRMGERLQINLIKEAPKVFGISAKTLQRRQAKGWLAVGESITIFMAADLLRKAVEIFGGMETAIQWLKEPNRAINNERPIDLLNDDMGRKIIEDLLGRIEHGVYE